MKKQYHQSLLQSAKEYCDYLEYITSNNVNQADFIDSIHTLLVNLYHQSISLIKLDIALTSKKHIDITIDESTINHLRMRLTGILGEFTDYSESFDPIIIEGDDNYSQGWLVDDLADIYIDLYRAVQKVDSSVDSSIQQAMWELRFGLGAHWGNHLINALRFVHYLQFSHYYKHIA